MNLRVPRPLASSCDCTLETLVAQVLYHGSWGRLTGGDVGTLLCHDVGLV